MGVALPALPSSLKLVKLSPACDMKTETKLHTKLSTLKTLRLKALLSTIVGQQARGGCLGSIAAQAQRAAHDIVAVVER